jgi:hypothetical protein
MPTAVMVPVDTFGSPHFETASHRRTGCCPGGGRRWSRLARRGPPPPGRTRRYLGYLSLTWRPRLHRYSNRMRGGPDANRPGAGGDSPVRTSLKAPATRAGGSGAHTGRIHSGRVTGRRRLVCKQAGFIPAG